MIAQRLDAGPIARLYAEARGWLADCEWRGMDAEDIADLSDVEIRAAVSKHYEGGWAAFMRASEAVAS